MAVNQIVVIVKSTTKKLELIAAMEKRLKNRQPLQPNVQERLKKDLDAKTELPNQMADVICISNKTLNNPYEYQFFICNRFKFGRSSYLSISERNKQNRFS
jgi:hypothetical protein